MTTLTLARRQAEHINLEGQLVEAMASRAVIDELFAGWTDELSPSQIALQLNG